MRRIIIFTCIFHSLTACMGPGHVREDDLTPNEKSIVQFDSKSDAKNECKGMKELGTIEAHSGTAFKMGTLEATANALKQKVAQKGGNAFYIIDHSKNGMDDAVIAKALQCN